MAETTEAFELPVGLLAAEHALFSPHRGADWSAGNAAAVRWQLQQEFRQRGLRWTQGGAAAGRKAAERQLAEIMTAGLIRATGRAGRRTHLRLTDRGRSLATALAGLPSLVDAHQAVRALLSFAPAGKLINELLPAGLRDYGVSGYQQKLYAFQCRIVPAIVAKWAMVRSDIHGRAAYSVTREGEAIAKQPEPKIPAGLPEPVAELCDLYGAEYARERERLRNIEPPSPNEVGEIPLSAGLWCDAVGPWNWPAEKGKR